MPLKIVRTLAAGAVCLMSANVCAFAAAELKVSGAAAVAGNIVMPNKAAIETESGLTLNVTANGDGNGLMDLYSGKVDVAMIAAPMKITEAALNKAKPDSLSIAGFEVANVGTIGISFITNAANPVKSLTEAQLKDIFTGKITSWKDVGGADKPILVVAEAAGFGTRSNIVLRSSAALKSPTRPASCSRWRRLARSSARPRMPSATAMPLPSRPRAPSQSFPEPRSSRRSVWPPRGRPAPTPRS